MLPFWGEGVWGEVERAGNLLLIPSQWKHIKALLPLFNLIQLRRVLPTSDPPVNLAKGSWYLHHRPKFSSTQICYCSLLPLLLIQEYALMELQFANFHPRVYFMWIQSCDYLTMVWGNRYWNGSWITRCSVSNEAEYGEPWAQGSGDKALIEGKMGGCAGEGKYSGGCSVLGIWAHVGNSDYKGSITAWCFLGATDALGKRKWKTEEG